MDLTLTRFKYGPDGVFGRLFKTESGALFAMTLEHAYDEGGVWLPKIPYGLYHCQRGTFPKHGETFEVTKVPGHFAILFHWGNYNTDSDGCILLGEKMIDPDGSGPAHEMVTSSRKTFDAFMVLQAECPCFNLLVNGGY